jgi:hypothetical protein
MAHDVVRHREQPVGGLEPRKRVDFIPRLPCGDPEEEEPTKTVCERADGLLDGVTIPLRLELKEERLDLASGSEALEHPRCPFLKWPQDKVVENCHSLCACDASGIPIPRVTDEP